MKNIYNMLNVSSVMQSKDITLCKVILAHSVVACAISRTWLTLCQQSPELIQCENTSSAVRRTLRGLAPQLTQPVRTRVRH